MVLDVAQKKITRTQQVVVDMEMFKIFEIIILKFMCRYPIMLSG